MYEASTGAAQIRKTTIIFHRPLLVRRASWSGATSVEGKE
jgi:hypothetical protein